MNFLPKLRRRVRMMPPKEDAPVECPGHLRWVRSRFQCCIAGKNGHECQGPVETHHEPSRGAGGGDDKVAPLCTGGHVERHKRGKETFAKMYAVDLDRIASALWQADGYHRVRYELALAQRSAS